MARADRPGVAGPLSPFSDGFAAHLIGLGYVSSGFRGQVALFAHLDRWLGAAGMTIADLTPPVLEQFLRMRAAEGYVTMLTGHGLAPLLEYLDHLGLLPATVSSATAMDKIVDRFHHHLLRERGVSEGTAANYARVARQFLAGRPTPLEASLASVTTGDVVAFVLAGSGHLSVPAMQTVVAAMRALLRFLYTAGLTSRSLAGAVPTVARRREELPRALPAGHIERLVESCDRNTAVGMRDFAIVTMLARLGLRANEVASLCLDDIDWAAGDVRIWGKGPRVDKLPLPADVGEALAVYLQHGRPRCRDRRVFIRSCAPRRGLSRQGVGGLVRAASARAGLAAHGPHRLRHTVATGLLRQGAPLMEIAQLLRHQSVQATSIYAKVDDQSLSSLAQPWPGGADEHP
ncbi:MAG: site-specific integrase [Actinomycetota bacterium]|nr:site-specific integrase [Actinomycetota bacterium]